MRVAGVDWRLDVQYREKSFSGEVSIQIEDAVRPLVLDAARLTIESAVVDGQPTEFAEDWNRGTLAFPEFPPGSHRLDLRYRGSVGEKSLVGPYVSPCGPGYALTTMMFPTGSGRLLPTFEHPAVKAVYRLVLSVDSEVKVVFNTAVRSDRTVGDRHEITFEPTPPMSAYLLYLGMGPFDTLTLPGSRWTVTVATSPGRAAAGRYCAERTTELLAAYEEYYGTPYPLPKLDLVALENFWAGAMENWGAIAFRENAVLVDPSTSQFERRAILAVLAHEVAHQWFGNLVTPAQWEDFWLNESFATFVGYRIMCRRYPEEDPTSYLLSRWVRIALEEDALASTHPVKMPVSSPEALGEVSDEVTYGKGAAVLRMIEAYLGEETFRRGISRYLARHQYANARAEDLWVALDEVSGRPVSRILSEWIARPGFPVVHAHWAEGQLTLRQNRFHADGSSSAESWPVPLRLASPAGPQTILLDTAEATVPLASPRGLRLDPGRNAFVRLHFDETLWGTMAAEFPSMDPIDQWGLVDDTHAFVYAGLVPLDRFLELVIAGTRVSAELPVRTLVQLLGDLYGPLHDVPAFLSPARRFLRGQLHSIGLDPRPGEPPSRALVRELLAIHLAGMDPAFADELAPRFAQLDRQPAELQRPVAISYAIAEGGRALEPLMARLRSTNRESERIQMAHALGSLRDGAALRQVLDHAIGTVLTPANAVDLLIAVTTHPAGGKELFDWYRSQSDALSRMWAGTPLLSLFLRLGIVAMGIDREEAVEQFFRGHTPPDAAVGVTQGLEALHLAARLRRRMRAAGSP